MYHLFASLSTVVLFGQLGLVSACIVEFNVKRIGSITRMTTYSSACFCRNCNSIARMAYLSECNIFEHYEIGVHALLPNRNKTCIILVKAVNLYSGQTSDVQLVNIFYEYLNAHHNLCR